MSQSRSASLHLQTIDVAPLLRPSTREARLQVAAQLHRACRAEGVFYVTGHGIETGAVVARMAELFALPTEQKRAVAVAPGGFARGYIGLGEESGSDALEVKEAFSYGFPMAEGQQPENAMQGPNVWPDEARMTFGFRAAMDSFYAAACSVADGLVRGLSLAHGHDESWLSGYCRGGETISLMRLFHYFPYEQARERYPERTDRIGSSAHTDWGFLTLIVQQDSVSGLQVMHDGQWRDVAPVPGALVVNCGDYLSMLTGGSYISPLHRVIAEHRERLSAVFFYYPAYDARIPVLGTQSYSLLHNQQQRGGVVDRARLAELSFGDYLTEKWRQVQRPRS
jgi:isopenicillin N synthase-like dioxygenase